LTEIWLVFFDAVKRTIQKLFGLVELFLFLRLLLKFLNASSRALVVNFIYSYSEILVSPFSFIFPNIYWPKGHFIETATISAMIGYALIVFVIFQLLKLLKN